MTQPRSNRVEFEGSQGAMLAARLDRPADPPTAWAVFAHCFTCSKDFPASARVSRALAARGVAVLRFDFTGLGSSAGDFANTHFSSNVEDLVRAADFLRREYEPPSLLVGHSLGGSAALAAAERIPESVAVATIGAPAEPAHAAALFAEKREEIETFGEAEVEIAGRRFRIRKELLEDIAQAKLEEALARMRKALLVLHSPVDRTVGIENASRIFQAARHPKSFVSLDRADHLLSRREDAVYAAELITAWASRYLPPRSEAKHSMIDGDEILVRESSEGRFTQEIWAGPHSLTTRAQPRLRRSPS